jgi:methoxymalonate biosynthesis protein
MDKLVKCLVWDLDNTLWRGTLLEGDDVRLAPGVAETLRTLDERGVLHSIVSRNDHDAAWNTLESLGVADYFLHPRIGWGRKPDALREVAEALNFALDTVAFVDDQPTELAEMGFRHPAVRCYPADAVPTLPALPEFSPPVVTVDARNRRHMYRAGAVREASRAAYEGPADDFLRTLDLRLTIRRATAVDLDRLAELTERTSQMNATGVHYGPDDLRARLADPDRSVLVATLDDRFGPHGAIGVVLLEHHPACWHLRLLATSCRVVSFGTGTVLLRWILNAAAGAGVHVVADFRATGRNRIMEVAYRFAGFTDSTCPCLPPSGTDDGIARLHLEPAVQPLPDTTRVDGHLGDLPRR